MRLKTKKSPQLTHITALNYPPLMRAGLLASLLACVLTLSACAGNQATNTQSSAPAKPNSSASGELTAEFVYEYLVAEIAGQRGDLGTSSALFYKLAQNYKIPSLAERAAKMSAYGKVPGLTVPAIKLWAELDPQSNEAQQAMTEIYIATGKLDEAKPSIAKLLVKEETRAGGFLYLSNLLSKSPDKAASLKLVQSLAAPYPTLPEAQFAIAQAAYSAKQNTLALQTLDKANALRPGWDLATLFKGQILFETSPQTAIDFYSQFLAQYPSANEVRINLAKILISQKQYSLAKVHFPKLIKYAKENKDKNVAEITALVGLLSTQVEDYVGADSYFNQAINLGFKDPDQLNLYLAQSAEKQNHVSQASALYSKISSESAHYLEAQIGLANIIADSQTADKAIAKLDAIEDLTTEQQIIVIQTQANILYRAQRNKESFALLDKAVKNMPNTPELMYDYALAAERVKKVDLMEKELRKVIAAKPNFAAAYNALGYSFADRNIRLNEAMQLVEKALSFSPKDYYMLDSLGWVHYRKGNLDKAINLLQQAYTANQDPEIAAHLGEVLWKKGKKDEAKSIWSTTLKANPKSQVLIDVIRKFAN
ncbi:MAG: tetratricopeptide repeat protein [Methylophilaceae bacterium]